MVEVVKPFNLSEHEQRVVQVAIRSWHAKVRRDANRSLRRGEVEHYDKAVERLNFIEDLYAKFGGDPEVLPEEEQPKEQSA